MKHDLDLDIDRENARLRRENQAMLNILRSLLDDSRWSELDALIQPEPITNTIQ